MEWQSCQMTQQSVVGRGGKKRVWRLSLRVETFGGVWWLRLRDTHMHIRIQTLTLSSSLSPLCCLLSLVLSTVHPLSVSQTHSFPPFFQQSVSCLAHERHPEPRPPSVGVQDSWALGNSSLAWREDRGRWIDRKIVRRMGR